jgi:hypothetical protein
MKYGADANKKNKQTQTYSREFPIKILFSNPVDK